VPTEDARRPISAYGEVNVLLSIVIPVFNEAESLPVLMERLEPILDTITGDCELIFVNDGSTDGTGRILSGLAHADRRMKVLHFSRNFGHQAAITAGIDFAGGDAVVIMDADLQDPPELIPVMVGHFLQGYDVVSAQRQSRPGDGSWKRWTAGGFYWFMRRFVDPRLPAEVGDFRLFSRTAVLALRRFREQHRFVRGLVAWLGLKEIIIPFQREERARGTTKYPALKMLQFAWTAVTSFSALPLRLSTNVGFAVTLCGIGYLLYSVFSAVVARSVVPGWTSLVCIQIIFSGAILMAVGVLGSYVARVYEESKQRPLYVVSETLNASVRSEIADRSVFLEPRLALIDRSAIPARVRARN
jgi:dolichol-phosphate mannosyltransferase